MNVWVIMFCSLMMLPQHITCSKKPGLDCLKTFQQTFCHLTVGLGRPET